MIKAIEQNEDSGDRARSGEQAAWVMIGAGAAVCGLGVALGAIGSHALEQYLSDTGVQAAQDKLANWDTAVTFQMYHGFAILLTGILHHHRARKTLKLAFGVFLLGIALFSGGLYVWVLTDWVMAVRVVPIGGIAFIGGWGIVMFSSRAIFSNTTMAN